MGQAVSLLSDPSCLDACELCPRQCGANRNAGKTGVCGADDKLRVARAALHFWEEPPISGERGSGAVFFSHCPLKCIFCQNRDISSAGWGKEVTVEELAQAMLGLQAQGAHNINLVTPTHYAPHIHRALEIARRDGLNLPVVYNTSSYERPCVLNALKDDVHVWLPDFKYASPGLAWELSRARDYPEVALEAIGVMVEQVRRAGGRRVDDDGIMQRGVIVRHLVLPGHLDDTFRVLQMLWARFGNDIDISIMNQYTPVASAEVLGSHTELSVPLPQEDYEAALDFSDMLGFENLWWQQGGTVGESFIPAFDGSGVVSGGQA